MAPKKTETGVNSIPGDGYDDTETEQQQGATWTPPSGAQTLELSEFVKFETVGDVLVCRVASPVRTRPDPLHDDKRMSQVTVSPCVWYPKGNRNKGEAFGSLALGIGAHLALLVDWDKSLGQVFAIRFEGERAPTVRGQRASRQFNVYALTETQFKAELAAVGVADEKSLAL